METAYKGPERSERSARTEQSEQSLSRESGQTFRWREAEAPVISRVSSALHTGVSPGAMTEEELLELSSLLGNQAMLELTAGGGEPEPILFPFSLPKESGELPENPILTSRPALCRPPGLTRASPGLPGAFPITHLRDRAGSGVPLEALMGGVP